MTALEKSKCANMADEIGDILTLTPSLYKALCDTPREIFAPVTRHAYSLDAQPIGGNQWISSPLTVAKMTLAPRKATTHIQNTAPGPPKPIAAATPAMLPMPTRPESDTDKA